MNGIPAFCRCLTWLGVIFLTTGTMQASDWPAFRGPDYNGVARNDTAPIHWGPNSNIVWKVPLPGPGNSSPIVSRGRVFITCAEDNGRQRNLYCFDRGNGQSRWMRTVEFTGDEPTHRSNPYCGSTPVTDGSRVVVWHGSAGVHGYDFEGKKIWETNLGPVRHDWGYGSSPILYKGNVILNFGPGARTFLVALDLESGEVLWKHEEPGGLDATDEYMLGSWSTPLVMQVDGRDQILCSMPGRVIACDAKTGALAWHCGGLRLDKISMIDASPVVCGAVGVAFTGWINGPTMGFKLGGSGDVTESNRLWLEKQTQRIGSGVAIDGRVYIVNAGPGTAQCIDCRSGKVLWTERMEGGESWGSVVLAGGRFYSTSRRGVTTVFRADPEKLEVLAMNNLEEQSHSTPAISDGQIFLRTFAHLYCIGAE